MSNNNPSTVTPILQMRNVSKTFPGVRALKQISLTVYPGEIHALMGENGAGKSTLIKILAGAFQPDIGSEYLIDGQPVRIPNPLVAQSLGIAVIYQELSLAPNLSVAENIFLGREPKCYWLAARKSMEDGCRGILERLGATFLPQQKVSELSIAERQLVEIARAVNSHARILVMDEPTTPLSSRETARLFDLVRQLRAEGMAIIYISHRMAEIYELADRVSVLRDGSYVGTLPREKLSADTLLQMMVGRSISNFYTKRNYFSSPKEPIFSVREIADDKKVRKCSFNLHAGEVLGISGLVGSGRSELARLIFGAEPHKSGEISLKGQRKFVKNPREAINLGIVYLTEDRKEQGLFLDMSVHDNINVMVFNRDAKPCGYLNNTIANERSNQAIQALGIRVPNRNVCTRKLSGGNQQKVLLARLLETKPQVLILDEPTRGIDIGAKSEIYGIIDQLASNGVGIVVISSELPELVAIADRVLVMREGQIVGEAHAGSPEMTQEFIIALATGATASC
jgi:ribose transport system ATP-binding protein